MSPSGKAITRVSQTLADYIGSLSENENAATRALILLGAVEFGLDPTLIEDDLRLTMAARLPPELYARLQTLRERVDHRVLMSRPAAVTCASGAAPVPEPGATPPALFPEPVETRVRVSAVAAPRAPAVVDEGAPRPGPAQEITTRKPQRLDAPDEPAPHMEEPMADGEERFDPFSGVGFDFDAPAS